MKEHKRFRPECPFLRGLVVNAGAYFSLFLDHLFICHICFYLYNYWGENVRFQIILLQSKYLFGIDIVQAINVGPRKFGKKNKT